MATTIGSRAVWISAARECFSASVEITVVRSDAQDRRDDGYLGFGRDNRRAQ